MKTKVYFSIGVLIIFLVVGGFFMLEKESKIAEVGPEVKALDIPSTNKLSKVSETALPGSRGTYKIDIQQTEDLRFHITAEIEVTNESDDVWKDVGFYFIPNITTVENKYYMLSTPGEAEITSIKGKDGEELSYTLENTMLYVTPTTNVKPGEKTSLIVDYLLLPPINGQRLSRIDNNFYLALWYPMLGTYSDKWNLHNYYHEGEFYDTGYGDYEITYNLAREYLVASSGEDGAPKSTKSGKIEGTNIKDFYIALLDPEKWISSKVKANDTTIRYFYPYDVPVVLNQMILDAKNVFLFMEKNIGDNPTKELDVVANNSGMEYPNIVEVWIDPGRHENVLIHEIAHQWFYFMVSSDPYEESWLDESLTALMEGTYRTLKYDSSQDGEELGFREINIFAERNKVIEFANIPVTEFGSEHGPILYGKIPAILRDFFLEQGGHEETIKFLSAYFNKYKYQYVDTETFVEFFNDYYQEDHTEFFKEWLILE
ncbi:M1 family aminopeptidase [Bacillus sp. FJAT-22090]|uniref:M1 family aminopeptidase n=1 Tax=Bacillus sp. FJAT-22090 TaxID=1581038 RepID=UPI0011A74837|nr:M1 family aminopeptidase [Bacillus sp. FJAT-22090]